MACALAMFTGYSYETILDAARSINPTFDPIEQPLPPPIMRRIAHAAGMALLSSIYMDWRYPGIIGVLSKKYPGEGHALFWDGRCIIDPGGSDLYDREYVEREAVEYTQRASDLSAVMELDQGFVDAAKQKL